MPEYARPLEGSFGRGVRTGVGEALSQAQRVAADRDALTSDVGEDIIRNLQGGVVNSNFEVHGTRGLRIVDASVFPKIPGFFIVSSVYMIGEKAADVILGSTR